MCGIRAGSGPLAGGLEGGRSGNSAAQATTILNCIFFLPFCFKRVLVIDHIKSFGTEGDRGCGKSWGSGAVLGKQSVDPRRNRTEHASTNLGFRFLFDFQKIGIGQVI